MSTSHHNRAASPERIGSASPHFAVLDGLRGIAAYCVVVFHSFGGAYFRNGDLSVDLFFMLSGFVVAHSYGQRLITGMPLRAFFLRRLVRLYPMLVVGVLLGVLPPIMHNLDRSADHYSVGAILHASIAALFLLPALTAGKLGTFVFPLNKVIWSLFFEAIVNGAWAAFARRMSAPLLTMLAAVGLIGILAIGPLGGSMTSDFWGGVPRVMFGFFLGALIHELWRGKRLPKIALGILPLGLLMIAVANCPIPLRGAGYVATAALFAMMILAGAHAAPGAHSGRFCSVLGAMSYPIYLIHVPILFIVTGLAKKFLPLPMSGLGYCGVVLAVLAICTVAALLLVILYETPVRRRLTALLLKPKPVRQSLQRA